MPKLSGETSSSQYRYNEQIPRFNHHVTVTVYIYIYSRFPSFISTTDYTSVKKEIPGVFLQLSAALVGGPVVLDLIFIARDFCFGHVQKSVVETEIRNPEMTKSEKIHFEQDLFCNHYTIYQRRFPANSAYVEKQGKTMHIS